jgi:transposase
LAKENQLPAYTILQQKSLLAIADQLPRDSKALMKIPGMGSAKVSRYGAEIVRMVEDYLEEQEEKKEPTWMRSARLFAQGKSIEDIAGEMLRAVSTVEGYIYTAVENGALDADLVVSDEAQDEIVDYMLEHREMTTLKNVYEHFDGKYSYLELRVARLQMKNL